MAYTTKILAPHLLPRAKGGTYEKSTSIVAIKLPEPASQLGPIDLMSNLIASLARAASAGFKVVSPEILEERLAICSQCEFWQPRARLGFGKCTKCGCTEFKHRLANEKCPIGKW